MKTKSLFYGFAAALLLAGCGPTTTSSQSASPSESETPSESTTPTSSEDDGIPAEWKQYELSTCAELNAVGATVADGERSTETYYIAATVKEITNPTYGQMVISDETGTFECYAKKAIWSCLKAKSRIIKGLTNSIRAICLISFPNPAKRKSIPMIIN